MIHDVRIKKLKLLPDDRGFLMEMLRRDDNLFLDFGQVYITGCIQGVAKGWHYHKEQTDHFVCVYGRALLVLCDMRDGSPSKGAVEEYILEAPPLMEEAVITAGTASHSSAIDPGLLSQRTSSMENVHGDVDPDKRGQILVQIPVGVMHGFTAYECDEARIINVPTRPYRYKNPDEYRYPWNSDEIPYKWPSYVKRGG